MTNLQYLCDAVVSICTKISEDCFQHIVEFMPQRIKESMKPPFPLLESPFSSPLNYISELNYISNKTEKMTLVKIMDHKYVALPSEIYKFHLQIVLN